MKLKSRTNRILFSILFITSLFSNSFAQNKSSLLWEITGNGLNEPSYLFGTIHIMCPDEISFSEEVKNALEKTDQIVLELDMDDPEFMKEMQRLSVNENMTNISNKFESEDWQIVNDYLVKNYTVGLDNLGVLKPFALLSMMYLKALECDQPGSFEAKFLENAKLNNKEVLGLETIEDQVAVFDKVSVEEQLSWISNYAKNEESFKLDMKELVSVYKSENVDEIAQLIKKYPEYKNIEDDLLYHRNKNWIAKITSHAKDKPTFFAVGAAHLGTDKGVINFLRQEGFIVKPL